MLIKLFLVVLQMKHHKRKQLSDAIANDSACTPPLTYWKHRKQLQIEFSLHETQVTRLLKDSLETKLIINLPLYFPAIKAHRNTDKGNRG